VLRRAFTTEVGKNQTGAIDHCRAPYLDVVSGEPLFASIE
jgi:hypothetical protein